MINFSTLQALTIPEGVVTQIADGNGNVVWGSASFYYVSLGDSIAAGQAVRDEERLTNSDYYYKWQYGTAGIASTEIISNSYTDLIRNELVEMYGENKVSVKSFARSGDKNTDLRDKLNHEVVQNAVKKANLVTICIGANTILGPALNKITTFIAEGNPTLLELNNTIEEGFTLLASDKSVYGSYRNIMTKLGELNTGANTKFVFTTVYNPYKYLWLDESTDDNDYTDGYFGPIFSVAPNVEVGIPLVGQMDVRKFLYESAYIPEITERINDPAGDGSYSLGEWVEEKLVRLNGILKQAVEEFGDSRFMVADTKAVFESYPDRYIREDDNYSDLVNVEIVKGQTVADLDWGQFWDNWSVDSLSNIVSSIADTIVKKVILPDTDPHPEEDGQYVLFRSFADALGWASLNRYTITFNANGGSGSMVAQTVVGVNNLLAYANIANNTFTHNTVGYYFSGWNTKADGSGITYTNGQLISVTSNITLYAQWSNIYTVTFRHSEDSNYHGSDETGPQECYALWIDGTEQADLSAFTNPPRTYYLPYGTSLGVIAQTKSGSGRSYITWNNEKVAGNSADARWGFTLTSNLDIHFQWNYWLDGVSPQSYWNCYITTK